MRRRIVGLDPGLEGGWAALDADTGAVLGRGTWPTLELERKKAGGKKGYKTVYLEQGMLDALRDACLADGGACHVYLEKQQAMPGQGVTSMFSTGDGYGLLRMAVVALGVPWETVTAQAWQKVMMAGIPKAEGTKASAQAHLVCARLWPGMDLREPGCGPRVRTPHSGICDALLLAEFGRRVRAKGGA
jgi:crossover junction endodeoxyribonuclease RuvC